MTQKRQAIGRFGERVAERRLVEAGMRVLDRNWRCGEGELDLVLDDAGVLVVCEVKTRSSVAYGVPHEAVTVEKLARLRRLAARWAREHRGSWQEIRIDLVAVVLARKGPAWVEHVRGLS